MKQIIFSVLVISLGLSLKSCNTTEPPPPGDTIVIKIEDVSCTEAWIELTTTNLQLPTNITLNQINPTGGTVTQNIILSNTDTLLYIDSLLPNQTYNFQSVIQPIKQSEIKSNELSVTTMDTTSHDFTFETFTFGGTAGSSTLYDVAIVGNEIWAVGVIYVADTSINGYTMYNAVHWDGSEWELKRIYFPTVCGSTNQTPYPASSIFAFDDGKIWISSSGDKIAILENNIQINQFCLPPNVSMSINKIWGSSRPTGAGNDLYVVGNSGNIAYYNGQSWQRIESGTDADLKDIYGTPDMDKLWTCGWSNQNGRVAILEIKENRVESIWDSQTNRTFSYYYHGLLLNTLWANGNGEFVLGTGVIIRHSILDKRIVRYEWVPYLNGQKVLNLGNYAYRIRGSNKNNIAVVGDAAMVWHYNGTTWHKFEEIYNFDDRLYGLAVIDNLIIAVGKSYSVGLGGALILVGRR